MAPNITTPLVPNANPNPTTRTRARRLLTKPTFLYPLKGIHYYSTHSFLWPLLRSRLLPATLLSALVLFNLFFWTYIPQVVFLTLFHGRAGALLNAAVLVLGEGAAVTALLFEAFFADDVMLDVFDSVLVAEGCHGLVQAVRPVAVGVGDDGVEHLDPRARLGKPHKKAVYSPFSFRQIVEFVLLLPLNFVPWIGVPLFLWLTGYRAGPLQHYRYFELRRLSKTEKRDMIRRSRVGYTSAGCMGLVLQLVPVMSMVFLLTTAAGSALWAVDIEREEGALRESGRIVPDEPPPEYSEYVDDPV